MSQTLFAIRPATVYFCIFTLLAPMPIQAVTNSGYRANTIPSRPSVAILSAPGGTRVNTFLGNVFLPREDLRIPGRGLPIELRLTYNSNQSSIASPFGFGWRSSYDMKCLISASRNIVVEWADGRTDLFRYGIAGYTPYNEGVYATLQQVGSTLRLTTVQQIQYSVDTSLGLLQRIQDPNGNALSFTYTAGLLTAITDAAGRSILLSHDAGGRVTAITDPNASPARTLQYAYDAGGNQARFTDPLGNVTTYAYDAAHRLTQVTDPLGITQLAYGTPNMAVANISRLSFANVVLSSTSLSYNTATSTTTVTDMLSGGVTSSTMYQYNSQKRLASITSPLGAVETATYDSKGNVASLTDPNGNTTRYTYDSLGNVLTVTDALNHTRTFTYNLFSRAASITDANGHTTTYSYDSAGNLLSHRDALGNVTTYTRDAAGQLVARRNALRAATTFVYDSFGDLVKVTDPLNRSHTFTYDQVGNLVSRTDANQKTTTYSYDARNRRTQKIYPDTTRASFAYDANGNLVSAIDPHTNQQFSYDAAGRLTRVADNQLSKTISYQYDGMGNRIQMIDPQGTVSTYAYDLSSRLVSAARNGQKFQWSYDNGGRLTQQALPNGSSTGYSYDAADRLLSLVNRKADNSVVSSFAYQYDHAGNRTALALAGGDQIAYSYDNDNQLVQELRTGAIAFHHQFSYDAAGNRVQSNADGAITAFTYDSADELTQETAGGNSTLYQYDGNGNRTQKMTGPGLSTYSYDFNDRLAGFASAGSAAAYFIDAFGRRASETVNAATTQFFYDGVDAVAEYDGRGALVAQNLFGPGDDNNLARFAGTKSFFYLHDGLNSVRNIVDEAQVVQNSYDYDAWGNILAKVEGIPNRYTFTGRETDIESGLFHYRARVYDPVDGRFLQFDPADDNTGRSAYLYVRDNPVNLVDPEGMVATALGHPAFQSRLAGYLPSSWFGILLFVTMLLMLAGCMRSWRMRRAFALLLVGVVLGLSGCWDGGDQEPTQEGTNAGDLEGNSTGDSASGTAGGRGPSAPRPTPDTAPKANKRYIYDSEGTPHVIPEDGGIESGCTGAGGGYGQGN